MLQNSGYWYVLTWKCASRRCGVQFFGIWTSKSGPELVCFVHFDLQMCFSLQRGAIFPHPNFKKWSEHGVFCTFWLATAACNFSFLLWTHDSAPAALASLLFDPPETQIIDFPNISRDCIFFLLTLLSSASAFHLSILSEVRLLNFLW